MSEHTRYVNQRFRDSDRYASTDFGAQDVSPDVAERESDSAMIGLVIALLRAERGEYERRVAGNVIRSLSLEDASRFFKALDVFRDEMAWLLKGSGAEAE